MKILLNVQFSQNIWRFARSSTETAFSHNFHTKKLGEISVLYAVIHLKKKEEKKLQKKKTELLKID